MFKLTYIRHGETAYNVKGLFQGRTDIPLNKRGQEQADLAGCYMKNVKFNRIYSSDLARCVQTADVIIRRNTQSPPDMIKDARLREKSFGDFEGRAVQEYDDWKKRERREHDDDTMPGAETREQVIERLESFLDNLSTEMSTMTLSYETDDQDSIARDANTAQESARSGDVEITPFEDLGYPNDTRLPHVLICSHGMLLQILMRLLQSRYRCRLTEGVSINRLCPNTGLTGFVFGVAAGKPRVIDFKFAFTDHHLSIMGRDSEEKE